MTTLVLNPSDCKNRNRGRFAEKRGGFSLWRGGFLIATIWLAGCSAVPPRQEAPPAPPAQFTQAGGTQPVAERWWQAFPDPSLGPLIERALADNYSLRATWARLRQANAVARREGAALWPSLDARATATSRQTASSGTTSTTTGTVTQNQVGLFSAYEIDLWGRVRAAGDAAGFDALASAADLQTAALTLSASVADTWYQLVAQRTQRTLLESQLATYRQLLGLVEARFRIGQSTASDVFRQRQLVAQTEGDLAQTEAQLNTLRHQLSILLGGMPGQTGLPADATLPELGPLPATGVPAELVRRRPDLQAAFLRLRAADARAAAAVAARYPRLDLTASLTSTDTGGALFSNWLGTLVAQLTAPLFDGGQRRAEVERTGAVVEEYLNNYGQTLLNAVDEVENALATEAGQRAYLVSLDAQLQLAEAVVRQERQRYFQGDVDYLSVLDALRSRQTLERQQVTARRQLISARIALVRALAGDWSMTPPATKPGRENPK